MILWSDFQNLKFCDQDFSIATQLNRPIYIIRFLKIWIFILLSWEIDKFIKFWLKTIIHQKVVWEAPTLLFDRFIYVNLNLPGGQRKSLTQSLSVEGAGSGIRFFSLRNRKARIEKHRRRSPLIMSSWDHCFALFVPLTRILAWGLVKDLSKMSVATFAVYFFDDSFLLIFFSSEFSILKIRTFFSRNWFRRFKNL